MRVWDRNLIRRIRRRMKEASVEFVEKECQKCLEAEETHRQA
jgi:TATA-binding protein-associated factor Taf7